MPTNLQQMESVLRSKRPTKPTADFLRAQRSAFAAQWTKDKSVRARGMPLPIPRDQGLHPTGCNLEAATLNFHFRASDEGHGPALAEFQVKITGLLEAGPATVELEDHWRIDAEVAPTQSKTAAKEGREPHPRFHFQRGGHAQDEFAAMAGFIPSMQTQLQIGEWRSLMQYPGPRIPSLPFDPILAIDFCIAQNDGPLWKLLRAIPEYRNLVRASQLDLWKPFIDRLSDPAGRRDWLGPVVAF